MKVASFITATLFIPPYPTNLVITTSPRDIGVRFRPPPLIGNQAKCHPIDMRSLMV